MKEYYSRRPRIKGGCWVKNYIKRGNEESLENEAFDYFMVVLKDFDHVNRALEQTKKKYTFPIRMKIEKKKFTKPTIEIWVG